MIPTAVRIFVCTERQDMRRSFDALALAVRESLSLDPESGALFVFASKRGNRIKVLVRSQRLLHALQTVARRDFRATRCDGR